MVMVEVVKVSSVQKVKAAGSTSRTPHAMAPSCAVPPTLKYCSRVWLRSAHPLTLGRAIPQTAMRLAQWAKSEEVRVKMEVLLTSFHDDGYRKRAL